MATRSSSGTGVVVSLVVFVLCTVFLLILSIVFYAGKSDAEQDAKDANSTLDRYVSQELRNRSEIQAIWGNVNPAQGESVVRYLLKQRGDVMGYLSGNPDADLETVKGEFSRNYAVSEDDSIGTVLRTYARQARSQQAELEGAKTRVTEGEEKIAQLEARIEQIQKDHRRTLDAAHGQMNTFGQDIEQYRAELQTVRDEYFATVDRLRDDYEDQIATLENQKDSLNQDHVSLKQRVDQLQEIISRNRLKSEDPAKLVDGHIIDIAGTQGQVFIDRGKKHRIVLGMTFEVYDDKAALQQIDRLTGELPRGKASLQVIKVAQMTSTCKITRSVPGRPVVRDDVIANAVYDPNYVFKFLVHGKFDVDNDGRPSEAEAEYLRSLIIKWGGTVVIGDQLPGDLDFLVLGLEPPMPLPPPSDATQPQLEDWLRKRRAHEMYQELFRQAREAQIPVLNANRFFILIGYTNR